eukprot:403376441
MARLITNFVSSQGVQQFQSDYQQAYDIMNLIFKKSNNDTVIEYFNKDTNLRVIDIEMFILAYVIQEQKNRSILLEKLKQYDLNKARLNDTKYKLMECQQSEKLNDYGIMEDSEFNVKIIDVTLARGSPQIQQEIQRQCQSYVMVKSGQQVLKSKSKQLDYDMNYDEDFRLDIESPDQIIDVSLFKLINATHELHATGSINLVQFNDQLQKSIEIKLIPKLQALGQVSVLLKGLWMHSRVAYYSDLLGKYEQNLVLAHDEITQLEFQEDQAFGYQALMITDLPIETLAKYSFIIYTILTILSMLYRPDFLNLTVSMFGSILTFDSTSHLHEHKGKVFYFGMFVLAILTVLYDVIFLSLAAGPWSNYQNAHDGGVELTLRRIVLAISFISLFFRVGIVYIFWKLFDKTRKNQHLKMMGVV